MLWRVCRGNVFLKQAEVDDPLEDLTTVSKAIRSYVDGFSNKNLVINFCHKS